MDAKTELLEILGDYVDVPVDTIDTSEGFKLDMGLDSFVLLSFIGAVEEHFGISIPNEKLRDMTTLDNLIAVVEGK